MPLPSKPSPTADIPTSKIIPYSAKTNDIKDFFSHISYQMYANQGGNAPHGLPSRTTRVHPPLPSTITNILHLPTAKHINKSKNPYTNRNPIPYLVELTSKPRADSVTKTLKRCNFTRSSHQNPTRHRRCIHQAQSNESQQS